MTLAEAMYLGKPVIATAYSGNTDFTHPPNSLLVDYELVQLSHDYGPYLRESYWADPDLEQASHYMQQLVADNSLRQRLAYNGQRYIRQNYSPEVVGEIMRQRCVGRPSFVESHRKGCQYNARRAAASASNLMVYIHEVCKRGGQGLK